jgi:DNA-binding beta-propeller fold protein YncE
MHVALATCALALFLLLAASNASAAPAQLWQACETGSGAGQCSFPRGITANPDNGHVYVADQSNLRIVELDAGGEFIKAWGWDVVASGPGDDTAAPEDQFEVCVPEEGDTCKKGTHGTGKGQFGFEGPQGLALDSAGNAFVVDRGLPSNQRVQKFSPAGQFLLMFGGEVNKTRTEEPGSTEAQRNLCTAASGDECQAGTEGTGQGQFGEWPVVGDWIAIDDKGTETAADDDVYVGDHNRIQVFDPEGAYQSQFAVAGRVHGLSTDSAGNLYAILGGPADVPGGNVHKLSPTGEPLAPETFEIPKLTPTESPKATAVAVNAAGNVYVFGPILGGPSGLVRDPIIVFDSTGNVVDQFGKGEFEGSTGLATNLCEGSQAPGNLYVSNASETNSFLRAYGTGPVGCFKATTLPASNVTEASATLNGTVDPDGSLTSECRFAFGTTASYGSTVPCEESPAQIGTGTGPVSVHADLGGLVKGTVYHFRLRAEIKGISESGSDVTFKTLGPPLISDDRTVSAAYTEASVRALINPEGFPTTYRVDYTPRADFEAQGFEGAQSSAELAVGSDRTNHLVLVNLTGLAPGTAYRWRLVATNSSGVSEGQDHALNTYRVPSTDTACPNSAFRTAASAFLPDCRAYEMVSPLDKNGGDIVNALAGAAFPGGYIQASPGGERITYTALVASFAGQPASLKFNQYLADREGGGWANQGIQPPLTGAQVPAPYLFGLVREFMVFSPDLCDTWLRDFQTPPPTADGQEDYFNLYRRQNCGEGAGELEALVPSPDVKLPPGTGPGYVGPHAVHAVSDDPRHAIFLASAKLTEDAAEGTKAQLYDRFEGDLALVSVLPSGEPAESGTSVGGFHNLDNALSADGSRLYWSSGPNVQLGTAKIYLRRHPEQGIVAGECTKATKACTLPVSSGTEATFWTAAADGTRALYDEKGKLFEFDLQKAEAEEPPRRLIASEVEGVAGASEDLSRIYFLSGDALPGSGQNSEGDEAQAGKPNLYLEQGGAVEFVATLERQEKEPGADDIAYNVAAGEPYRRAARVTPDGSRIVFNSRAPLTGYDNLDTDSGKPAVEVFRYEAGGELLCVSCNPSGARPRHVRELRIPYRPPFELNSITLVRAAAWIPTWEHKLHASNVLSADGDRIFFNANDALLPRDTNGAPDVYEWEAPGTGSCDAEDASYLPQNGGCLYLISSGESSEESEFWEATPDGDDVFFNTASSLLPQDPGSVDLYDARVGGGFPLPAQKAACEGEACQSAPPPPNDPTPGSASLRGPGNLVQKPPARCRKGKVRRRGRCVQKHKKRARSAAKKRRANSDRRAKR